MRVNRSYLYWGVFLVALGGVIVATDLAGVDEPAIGDLVRLWPLVIVMLGVALVLRRTPFSVAGGMVAAALPGLVLGGMIAVGPDVAIDCAGHRSPTEFTTEQGTFVGPANVEITTRCGVLTVSTATGSGWTLEAGNTKGNLPDVDATADRLSIGDERRTGWLGHYGRDDWRVTLPTTPLQALDVVVNAGEGDVDLANARIGRLAVTTNAGRSVVDLSSTAIDNLDGTVNAGQLRIDLPGSDDFSGTLDVNAGAVTVCAPPELGLRVRQNSTLASTDYRGLVRSDGVWESPDYESAAHHADLTVDVNLGELDFNPIGECQ